MLGIVPHCNFVQYQGKLMMQLWENDKNSNFKPNLPTPPSPPPPPIFSWVLPLLVVRQCSKLSSYTISRNINEPNLKKWQKPNLGPNFGPNNFLQLLTLLVDIIPSYHPMQFKEKLMSQIWENHKKPNFGPDFSLSGPNWGPHFFFFFFFCASFSSTSS